MGIIIAGFATCGKSVLGRKYKNVLDLESSPFKNIMRDDIAYPNINDWEEVEKRCIERGNNTDFIRGLKNVFIPFYDDSIKRNYDKLYILNGNETLEDVLIKDNIHLIKNGRNL